MDGEPLLLVTDSGFAASPFGAYLGEILKTEGFVSPRRVELAAVDPALLSAFPLVVLAEARPDPTRGEMLRRYVTEGGRLIAMRPDPDLADLFGLEYAGPRRERLIQYLAVDPASEVARGVESTPLQYHGEADEYRPAGATVLAWLCESASVASPYPAVTLHRYGRGLAVAFTYDLARSVAFTRQGNPDWTCGPDRCEDGDGVPGLRPVDAFLRQSGERWVDVERIPIPQADEQQRLLSSCLMALSDDVMPLPRLWYLPQGNRAVLVMTSDGDDAGSEDFEPLLAAAEEYGGHFSAYLHPLEGDPTRAQAEDWIARGHEVALHLDYAEGRDRPTLEGFQEACDRGFGRFTSLYGRPPGPSIRHHCLTWHGWVDAAQVTAAHGVRVDFNYYHGRRWQRPEGGWANGYFTGSGLPQRLVDRDGTLLDVFQTLTQWADEAQLYTQGLGVDGATHLVQEMLEAAERRYPTVFVANFHPGGWKRRGTEPWARNMMAEAARRGVHIWSGQDLYRFLAARDGARFSSMAWDGTILRFALDSPAPHGLLSVMLPARLGDRRLRSVSRDGAEVRFWFESLAGREYALVETAGARHEFEAAYRS